MSKKSSNFAPAFEKRALSCTVRSEVTAVTARTAKLETDRRHLWKGAPENSRLDELLLSVVFFTPLRRRKTEGVQRNRRGSAGHIERLSKQ